MKTADVDIMVISSCLSCAAENSWQVEMVIFSVSVPKQFCLPPLPLLLVPARA